MRQYLARRYQKRRSAAIERLGGACVQCGSTDDLQLDHIDRSTKSTNIAKLILAKDERLLAELAKCQVLCAGCHQKKTSAEMGVEHGGGVKGKHNCPCLPCREASRRYCREYSRRMRAA